MVHSFIMNTIKILPLDEQRKIAAGEVIDRPANIVKELIENALDAHATQITVHLVNGGKDLIRVVDNGSGMNPEDAQLCFEHHATSKITRVDDLHTISSFGFRGEALSSISSVSTVLLRTKQHDADHGTRITIKQDIKTVELDSCPAGTDITITDLFYNVPARKKFLKTKETELRHIQNLFQALCLDYGTIHFKLFCDNTLIYNCPPTLDPKNRIAQLYDHTVADQMLSIEISHQSKNITLSGVISNHHYARYDRSALFFFVNKRWVKNYGLSKALLKGYLKTIAPGRFPAAVLSLQVNPEEIDINIHPRKEEVKLVHAHTIESMIEEAVRTALQEKISVSQEPKYMPSALFKTALDAETPEVRAPKFPEQEPFAPQPLPPFMSTLRSAPFSSEMQEISSGKASVNAAPEIIEQQSYIQTQEVSQLHLIGQFNKTYLLCEHDEGLYLIDQHAAHERILYQQFEKRFDNQATTHLLFPQLIPLHSAHLHYMQILIPLLAEYGIEVEIFGNNQLKICAIPVYLKSARIDDIIFQAIGWFQESDMIHEQELKTIICQKLQAQMACSAAVKAGDVLSHEQMQKLLEELAVTENRFSCPHGRPTGWLLPFGDIQKKFKRDYRSYERRDF